MARSERSERGSLQLDQALVIVLLVLVAGVCLYGLGESIACSFARSQAEFAPQSDYAGRCVPLEALEATVAPAGTSRLAWTGGVPPFAIARSASPLVALEVPAGMAVAYAADATAVEDLDGNPADRSATVPTVPGLTYYRVQDAKGNAVVATTNLAPPAGTIEVLVKDAAGNPMSGVEFAITESTGNFSIIAYLMTDANGWASQAGLPAGTYIIGEAEVVPLGFRDVRVSLADGRGVLVLLALPPSVVDVGTGPNSTKLVIYGPDGQPVAAGFVLRLTIDGAPEVIATAATDALGHATFTGLANYPYTIAEFPGSYPMVKAVWSAPAWWRLNVTQ